MQVRHWQNDRQLFGHTLKVTENNALAENIYGLVLSKEGRFREAEPHLSKAVQICPASFDARNNLGKVFLKQGKSNEAIECFNELIKRKQDSAEVYYNLALVSGMQKKYDDAIKYLTTVLKLDPKYPDAHNKMGAALLAMEKTNEAIAYLNKALRIDTEQANVYLNLGIAYEKLGEYEPAIQNWTKALELKPDNTDVLNNLAWLLATTGDVSTQDADRAIKFAQCACELTGYEKAGPLDTLAAAYAAGGRFDDAKATAEKALNAAKAAGQEDLARKIEGRLELYQEGQPYRRK
jgi:tetratricopeptide (TPR) repeat protein